MGAADHGKLMRAQLNKIERNQRWELGDGDFIYSRRLLPGLVRSSDLFLDAKEIGGQSPRAYAARIQCCEGDVGGPVCYRPDASAKLSACFAQDPDMYVLLRYF